MDEEETGEKLRSMTILSRKDPPKNRKTAHWKKLSAERHRLPLMALGVTGPERKKGRVTVLENTVNLEE